MNKYLSWIGALFLIGCVGAAEAADPDPSHYISRLGLPDGAKLRIGRGRANSIAYSPDSKRLAVGGTHGVWIIDAQYGKEVALLQGHTRPVKSAEYAPDGKTIASASEDRTARIWDAETGALLHTLEHRRIVNSAAYSPDGKTIVTGCFENKIRIWDAQTGALLKIIEGHTDEVNSTQYSPDGGSIVSGSGDGTARIWDAETGALLRVLEGHTERVTSAAYSPDGKTIATGSYDTTVRVWDAETGALLHTLKTDNRKNTPLCVLSQVFDRRQFHCSRRAVPACESMECRQRRAHSPVRWI